MWGGVWPEGLSRGRGPRWRFGLTSVSHRSPWKLLEGGADLTLHNSIYSLAVRISRTRRGRERLEGPPLTLSHTEPRWGLKGPRSNPFSLS